LCQNILQNKITSVSYLNCLIWDKLQEKNSLAEIKTAQRWAVFIAPFSQIEQFNNETI